MSEIQPILFSSAIEAHFTYNGSEHVFTINFIQGVNTIATAKLSTKIGAINDFEHGNSIAIDGADSTTEYSVTSITSDNADDLEYLFGDLPQKINSGDVVLTSSDRKLNIPLAKQILNPVKGEESGNFSYAFWSFDVTGINKVIFDGQVLVDLSEDTAVAEDVAEGKTFHTADGLPAIGTAQIGGGGGIAGGYNVTFVVQGEDYAFVSVRKGDSVQAPVMPQIPGYYFKGWFPEENGGGERVPFPYTPESDVILYAFMDTGAIVGFVGMASSAAELTLTDDIANVPKYTTSENSQHVNVINQLDEYWPFSEIKEFTDDNGNVFVKFPKMYMQWVLNGTKLDGVRFADHQPDGSWFISDAFLDPRDETCQTYLDYFALGKYEGSGSSSKVYSKSGQTCLVNITRANFRAGCRAYGTAEDNYKGYQSMDVQQLVIYNMLCMMYYRTQNIQTVYGGRTGYGTGSSWSSASPTGSCDALAGMNGWSKLSDCVKMLGVENPYGNIYKWIDGIVFSSTSIYIQRLPQTYSDNTSGAARMDFSRPSSSSYISALRCGADAATRSAVYASSVSGGSAATYVGDYCYYSSSGVVLSSGGYWSDGSRAGLWGLNGDDGASDSYASIGGRLSFRPL